MERVASLVPVSWGRGCSSPAWVAGGWSRAYMQNWLAALDHAGGMSMPRDPWSPRLRLFPDEPGPGFQRSPDLVGGVGLPFGAKRIRWKPYHLYHSVASQKSIHLCGVPLNVPWTGKLCYSPYFWLLWWTPETSEQGGGDSLTQVLPVASVYTAPAGKLVEYADPSVLDLGK